jgi:hypothetical protein
MGTWSNSNHGWYGDDMDSSDGTNEKKLVVRNHQATATSRHAGRPVALHTETDW